MNTFFFGYLSLKWRRLIRTLCVIIALSWLFNLWDTANLTATSPKLELHEILFYFSLIILPISLISWLVKPFVVKE